MTFFEKLKQERIIPVVKIQDAAKAPALARALLDGGISVIELTFRTDAAADAIRTVCRGNAGDGRVRRARCSRPSRHRKRCSPGRRPL